MFISKDSITVENAFVFGSQLVKYLSVSEKAIVYDLQVNNDIRTTKLFSSNATAKTLIKFQAKLGTNGIFYYNIDLDKYYKAGQAGHDKAGYKAGHDKRKRL